MREAMKPAYRDREVMVKLREKLKRSIDKGSEASYPVGLRTSLIFLNTIYQRLFFRRRSQSPTSKITRGKEQVPMKLLTLDQAAAFLSLNPITLRKHIRAGKLRAAKIGKLWRIDQEDVLKFIRNEQKATKEIMLTEQRAKKNDPIDLPGQEHFEGVQK